MTPWLVHLGSCLGWSALVMAGGKTAGAGPPGRGMSAELSLAPAPVGSMVELP